MEGTSAPEAYMIFFDLVIYLHVFYQNKYGSGLDGVAIWATQLETDLGHNYVSARNLNLDVIKRGSHQRAMSKSYQLDGCPGGL